jgi:hypothetical protein
VTTTTKRAKTKARPLPGKPAPKAAKLAPIVIHYAQSLPVPEVFADTLAAHAKAGGTVRLNGYDRDGREHDFHDDAWLLRLHAAMVARGMAGWANRNNYAAIPRGWVYIEHGHSDRHFETLAKLVNGSVFFVVGKGGKFASIGREGMLGRTHIMLSANDMDSEHRSVCGLEVEMPTRDYCHGLMLADMPVMEPDADDADLINEVEVEEMWADIFGRVA